MLILFPHKQKLQENIKDKTSNEASERAIEKTKFEEKHTKSLSRTGVQKSKSGGGVSYLINIM